MIISGRVGYSIRSPEHEEKNILNAEEPEQKNGIESTHIFLLTLAVLNFATSFTVAVFSYFVCCCMCYC